MLAGYRMLNGLFAIKDGQALLLPGHYILLACEPKAGCGVELGPLKPKVQNLLELLQCTKLVM